MYSKWPWNLPKRSSNGYSKKLEGIELNFEETKKFRALLSQCLDAAPVQDDAEISSESSFSTAVRNAVDTPSYGESKTMLIEFSQSGFDVNSKGKGGEIAFLIPLPIFRAMTSILADDQDRLSQLNNVLEKGTLSFTAPPPVPSDDASKLTPEQRRFRKRMDRLRLKDEESKYMRLTRNIDTFKPEDEITTRSMTYAASVGLNMIVAPISFGVFMYFFAGQIFSWIRGDEFADVDENAVRATSTDIRRVIAGVVSGVAMLFIEMILFVIRTHEFEKATAKKKRKRDMNPSPFGYKKPVVPVPPTKVEMTRG